MCLEGSTGVLRRISLEAPREPTSPPEDCCSVVILYCGYHVSVNMQGSFNTCNRQLSLIKRHNFVGKVIATIILLSFSGQLLLKRWVDESHTEGVVVCDDEWQLWCDYFISNKLPIFSHRSKSIVCRSHSWRRLPRNDTFSARVLSCPVFVFRAPRLTSAILKCLRPFNNNKRKLLSTSGYLEQTDSIRAECHVH